MKWDEAVLRLQNHLPLVFQEQYQFVYKAMLSLVSTKENGNGPMTVDRNGAALTADESDPAESMESLVWLESWKNASFVNLLKTENFLEAFFLPDSRSRLYDNPVTFLHW